MTERQDDFERRFGEAFRAYLSEGTPVTDPKTVARRVTTTPMPRRIRWGGAMAVVGAAIVTGAAVLAIVFVRIGTPPVASSPSPSAFGSPSVTESSTTPGTIFVACEAPVVPGHCLQPVAWAIQQLPTGHAPVASVAISTINLCPDASPCVGPPHRGEWWAAFTLRDGSHVGMWVVEMMGIAHVQSVGTDATPPPGVEPATGEFPLACGGIPDATCAGAAGGATEIVPYKPPQDVLVQPRASHHFLVTFSFDDGTQATAEVAPDSTRDIGWSAVQSAAP